MNQPRPDLESILLGALELEPAAQGPYLDERCGDDAHLRQSIEALLAAHDEMEDSFLLQTQAELAGEQANADTAGSPYRLIKQIGEGGMGTVWLAQQTEPIKRIVAIKLIKAGMDSRQVLARFEAERQALALMDHPNIARVLDAGMTQDRRPYFAMEFVQGVPLTEFCNRGQLTVRQRLELFLPICNAVQHAHQKGIIHRDLKPSNILVCLYDGKPVPKVIDFGLAKAFHQSLTERTLQTAHGMMVGTPLYMSPEQADANNDDIDTRTDVYSLGVILYELLTGTTPLEQEHLREAAVAEVLRLIKDVEPPRPSTRLSQSDSLPSVAAQRNIDPAHLKRSVSGDLDWVVMRALEKDRNRRYESASGLAADIQRHLSDEPVSAGPPSARYRVQKFIKRNRAAVITTGIVAVALVLGVVGTTGGLVWALAEKGRADQQAANARQAAESEAKQRQVAEASEERARIEASRSAAVAEFLQDALAGVGPSVALGRDTTLLEEILQRTTEKIETELKNQPEVEATIRSTLSATYGELALYEEAENHTRRALELYQDLHSNDHADKAQQLGRLGVIFELQGKVTAAERYYQDSLTMHERLNSTADDETEGETLRDFATLLTFTDRPAEARELLDKALEKFRQLYGGDEHADVATIFTALGNLERSERNFEVARGHYERALQIHQRVLPAKHPFIMTDMRNLAGLMHAAGDSDEAEQLLRQAIALQQQVLDQHPHLAETLHDLGWLLNDQGRFDEAEEAFQKALSIGRLSLSEDHPQIRNYLTALAILYGADGRQEEALAMHRTVLELDLRSEGGDRYLITTYNNIAYSLMELERPEEAEEMYRKAILIGESEWPDGSRQLATCLNNLGRCCRQMGRMDEALAHFERALEMRQQVFGEKHAQVANTLTDLGSVYADQGNLEQAEKLSRMAVAMFEESLGPKNLYTAIARGKLAGVLDLRGKVEEAEAILRETLAPINEAYGPTHRRTLQHRAQLGHTLAQRGQWEEARVELDHVLDNAFSRDDPPHPNLKGRDLARTQIWMAEVLIQQKAFARAEELLLAAEVYAEVHGGLGNNSTVPANVLVQLYESWHLADPTAGHDTQAAKWREKAARIEQ